MIDHVFSPAFGNRPRVLVGRDLLVRSLLDGLYTPVGSKDRAVLLLGQRGYGKTVLLLEIAERARESGFLVTSPSVVTKGFSNRLLEKCDEEAQKAFPQKKRKIAGGSVGLFGFSAGVQLKDEAQEKKSFASQLAQRCQAINAQEKGLFLLIDEVQANNEELRELIIAYQEMVGAGMDIAIMMAGLPGAVSSTLNDHVLTFLNRAKKIELAPLNIHEVEIYYNQVFSDCGIRISPEQIRIAAERTEGSPYLMQLIGHYLILGASEGKSLQNDAFEMSLRNARLDFMNDICETSIQPLSEKDRTFLAAMTEDLDESKISDIASRLHVTEAYAQTYKRRLIQAGVLEQAHRGTVRMTIPYMRDFLREKYN